MGKDKVPPEYGDDTTFDRPPPYNPHYDNQASGSGPPPSVPSFYPPSQPPPEYQVQPGYNKSPLPNQQQPVQIAPQQTSIPTVMQTGGATVTNVQIHISDEFGPYSQHAICPKCHQYIVTKTKSVAGCLTWLSCLGLFMIGCDLCCCFIPCCVDSCRDVIHRCPNCGRKVGRFKRMC
ncbi:lipopolysaccharide-induced tumor necrosis factor-alpha factor homolog [Tetranychus urticae]|uniref:LITAF domain-containing protein n=1 Tax=Tetranychus urticae TaxID=32264 RepID=T1KY38_TETUR|nr:lipopolysaccharide-induced tumor necrosis factor-alpha factor homolog [Tetranychus urticae]XP_015791627.1 lipopolysaccharide-induced tumor necrosis factor-alpha factor homolog [Tetranychus urticae]